MPIQRRLDESSELLRTTISGRVTVPELREHFAGVRAAGEYRLRELIDATGVTAVAFNARDLTKLAEYGRELFGGVNDMAPRAVVVHGVVHFGMARLFASFVRSWVRISVFDNMPAAEAWVEMMILTGI